MYIQEFKRNNNGKISKSVLLVESYRENGKQKRRTIANLTRVPEKYLTPFKAVIKNKEVVSMDQMRFAQGKSFGALYVLDQLSKELGLHSALGKGKQTKLALLQIFNKVIDPHSRLGILRDWTPYQAVEDVLGLDEFSLDDLYTNLEWLSTYQQEIERKLFNIQGKAISTIYLYDVTSSYLEGQYNELAHYGYNRDGKKGKKQIVIGLLTDQDGDPVSVEVFQGNTSDTKTFASQIEKLRERFEVKKVVVVGDKGMIKSAQIEELQQVGFHYITSITKAQINALLKKGSIQLSLFDNDLAEVESQEGRYILRKNAVREKEITLARDQKINKVKALLAQKNQYLQEHPKARLQTAIKHIKTLIEKLKIGPFVYCEKNQQRSLKITIDQKQLEKQSQLDGCYVLKTDLSKQETSKEKIHKRYKDLAKVEQAFRTLKTTCLEIRPVFLRNEKRTKGHIFAAMLAYKLIKTLMDRIGQKHSYTKNYVIQSLNNIHFLCYQYGEIIIKRIPDELMQDQKQILNTLNIPLPKRL